MYELFEYGKYEIEKGSEIANNDILAVEIETMRQFFVPVRTIKLAYNKYVFDSIRISS